MKLITHSLITILMIATVAVSEPYSRSGAASFKDYITGGRSGLSLGLIDPSRVSFSHTVQMGFSSFKGGSLMQSLYATTARYRLSDPVSLEFTLGMIGGRFNGPGAPVDFRSMIGGASLDYRPSRDFHMRVEFNNLPVLGGWYGPGGENYGRW